MISLSNILKKSRCNFEQLPALLYGMPYQKIDHYKVEEYEEPIDKLFFREHFNESAALTKEMEMMDLVHQLSFVEKEEEEEEENKENKEDKEENEENESEKNGESEVKELLYPVHPYVKAVRIMGRTYTAYHIESDVIFVPTTMEQVTLFMRSVIKSLKSMHEQRHYVSNIVPNLFLWNGHDIDTLSFSPSITQFMKHVHEKERTSIIMGTFCISPYQILWDMLHSKSEQDLIEYSEFRKKMQTFWENILKPEFKFVPKICQKVYSERQGSLSFIDYCINRWCKVLEDKTPKMIEKSTIKVKSPAFLYSIDFFGLAIQIIRFVELLKTKNTTNQKIDYTPEMKDFIYDALICA